METNTKILKNPKLLYCEPCDYKTVSKKDFNKHLETLKHINLINPNLEIQTKYYTCNCGKEYKHSSSLCAHKKKCSTPTLVDETTILDASSNEIKILTTLVLELVKNNTELQKQTTELQKQNQDFQKQMIDVCQKIQPTTINNNTNTNSHNKTFNLQLFLNEECKDAMNMSDFINSIEIKLSDLVNIGKLGYVEGMSNIIIKQLNDTDVNKRPVHCSDAKRETLYVKEENKWEKETQETKQMLTAVRGVNKKNFQLLTTWKETHPKCMDSKSNQSDEYMKVVSKVMDGDVENINKVIKKVAKEVVIDK